MASLLKTWRRTRNSESVSVRVLAATASIAAFVLILSLTWARLRPSRVLLPKWNSRSYACHATLDWLDHTYDKRRDARILSTKNNEKVMNKKAQESTLIYLSRRPLASSRRGWAAADDMKPSTMDPSSFAGRTSLSDCPQKTSWCTTSGATTTLNLKWRCTM